MVGSAGTFKNLDHHQIAALSSCFIPGDSSNEQIRLKGELGKPLQELQDTARKIAEIQRDCKCGRVCGINCEAVFNGCHLLLVKGVRGEGRTVGSPLEYLLSDAGGGGGRCVKEVESEGRGDPANREAELGAGGAGQIAMSRLPGLEGIGVDQQGRSSGAQGRPGRGTSSPGPRYDGGKFLVPRAPKQLWVSMTDPFKEAAKDTVEHRCALFHGISYDDTCLSEFSDNPLTAKSLSSHQGSEDSRKSLNECDPDPQNGHHN